MEVCCIKIHEKIVLNIKEKCEQHISIYGFNQRNTYYKLFFYSLGII